MSRRRFHAVRILAILVLLTALTGTAARAADAPTSLAGITLGDEATRLKTRIRTDKPKEVDGSPWLRRLPVMADKFYAGGYVLVGTCAAPGRVIRIKMRYRDASMEFYRKIAGDMLQSYGDPTEYKGEFDGRTMGNKWSFTDTSTRPVSLILQRTEGEDPETGTGNTVKLTNWGLIEAERACWQEHRAPALAKTKGNAPVGRDNGYLPR